jgi:hypothetical protein
MTVARKILRNILIVITEADHYDEPMGLGCSIRDEASRFNQPHNQTKGKVMASSTMRKFLVLYLVPATVIDEWVKTDPDKRKVAEEKMQGEWGTWMGAHSKMIISTDAGGKTKRVTSSGIADTRNDIMLYSIVEAESHDAAAKSFENHPHLQIPQSSIEIMEITPMGGM